jgi:hypothetical protein
MKTIAQTATNYYTRYHNSLKNHPNNLAKDLALPIPENPPKRLKRKWCRDFFFS